MNSFDIRPFAFDRVFKGAVTIEGSGDALDEALELEAVRDELALLKQQHAEELALSRAEAFEAGLAHARSERDTAVLAAVDALQATFEAAEDGREQAIAELTVTAADLALAAGEAIAGRALTDTPGEAIDQAVGRVLRQIARGQEVHIHVHPDLSETIEGHIARRQEGDRRKLNLHVVPDAAVNMGDAMVNWDGGGITFSAEDRRQAVREELSQLIG